MSTKSTLQAESESHSGASRASGVNAKSPNAGTLIINADDWGQDNETTQRILECVLRGSVSAVSAMVFMADSERAAEIALERTIDAGLHLNLTTPFTEGNPTRLAAHQEKLIRHLRKHRLAPAIYHPGLGGSFEYVVRTQLDEFRRLYGTWPGRIDGHHHMHLCANVLMGALLPEGTIVRRNFTLAPGEKSLGNRMYRKIIDRVLARRHQLTDYFFSLPPIEPARVQKIFSLANKFTVEVETHPVNPEEYNFLTGPEIVHWIGNGRFPQFGVASSQNKHLHLECNDLSPLNGCVPGVKRHH